MFAKIFGQIFDSSIAEDYNCRRMFMDLLVLADSDGVVDMTHEAIARRANVPIEEVRRYIQDLSQPDPTSRSKMEDGRRLVPIDPTRDWGWLIVNYQHYRKVRDEEVRRSYFRDAQRKYRATKKKQNVKDKVLTPVDNVGQVLTPPSASPSSSSSSSVQKKEGKYGTGLVDSEWLARLAQDKTYSGIDIKREHGKMINWCNVHSKIPSRARFINWLNRAEKPMEGNAAAAPRYLSFEERKKRKGEIQEQLNAQFRARKESGFTPEEEAERQRLRGEMEAL